MHKERQKYLGIIWEADIIKQTELRKKNQKWIPQKNKNLMETKLNSRNLIKEINT